MHIYHVVSKTQIYYKENLCSITYDTKSRGRYNFSLMKNEPTTYLIFPANLFSQLMKFLMTEPMLIQISRLYGTSYRAQLSGFCCLHYVKHNSPRTSK
jgi:hypothetical protein